MQLLSESVYQNVPLDEVTVRSTDFNTAAKLHPSLPWIKIALVFLQWMSNSREQGSSGKSSGNTISKQEWDRLAKVKPSELQRTENCLGDVKRRYSPDQTPSISEEAFATDVPAVFVRVAKKIVLTKDYITEPIPLGEIEWKLRNRLEGQMELPQPVVDSKELAPPEAERNK